MTNTQDDDDDDEDEDDDNSPNGKNFDLNSVLDDMVETGDSLLHLDEPLLAAVKLIEFLGNNETALILDNGLVWVFFEILQ